MTGGSVIQGKTLKRFVFVAHRWLGIFLGGLMALWAASGVTMMYVAFPELTADEARAGLDPVAPIATPWRAPAEEVFADAHIEMLAGRPVLRWKEWGVKARVLYLDNGAVAETFTANDAATIAAMHFAARGQAGAVVKDVEIVERDQWTVYSRFHAHRPLFKAAFDAPNDPVLYVSSVTGAVVQDTGGRERFWNWLGAVPHWLYYTAFRQHASAWYQFIVWTSVLGAGLTASGLYIGLLQTGRGKGRLSPYRGLSLFHHVTGLTFGVLTFTWVVSGLFSMNPWGLFESAGAERERANISGGAVTGADVNRVIVALRVAPAEPIVRFRLIMQNGEPIVIAERAQADPMRLTSALRPAALSDDQLLSLGARLRPDADLVEARVLNRADSFYYSHHESRVFPVLRLIFDDAERTRYYLDPRTGELLQKTDRAARLYRWLHYGLHRLDFHESLRRRPIWDVIVTPLVVGVTALCLLGVCLGARRIARKTRRAVRPSSKDGSDA